MKVALLTREFPPDVYGGAGVHVEHLARELATSMEVEVHCFGQPRQSGLVAAAYEPWDALPGPAASALRVMSVNLAMAAGVEGADILHSHTWYANLGGHLGKLLFDLPHVVTSHSLEPLRPWKQEQLGGGYALSLFCERTAIEQADAVIAVSEAMRADILSVYPLLDPARVSVIHNGVDAEAYWPDPCTTALQRLGIDLDRPIVLFVGRITRQKGVFHLLEAARHFDPLAQLVLCAASPDTEELALEMRRRLESLRASRGGVVWVEEPLPRSEVVQLMSHAAAFVCPSVYEPFGLVNVEAMACEAPVVASTAGGIPEIVRHGETGYLVPLELADDGLAPVDPARFALDLAQRVNELIADPPTARRFGKAGRWRVLEQFSWPAIAKRTIALYERVLAGSEPVMAGRPEASGLAGPRSPG